MIEVVELTKIDFYLSFFSVDKKQISMARSSYLHSNLLLNQPLQTYIFHKASCQSQIYVLNQGVGGGIFVNTCLQRNTCMYLQMIYGFIQFSPFTGKSSSPQKKKTHKQTNQAQKKRITLQVYAVGKEGSLLHLIMTNVVVMRNFIKNIDCCSPQVNNNFSQ